jgi:hypothetical protein
VDKRGLVAEQRNHQVGEAIDDGSLTGEAGRTRGTGAS